MFLEKVHFGQASPDLNGIMLIEGLGNCSNVYLLDGCLAMVDTGNVRGITNEIDEECNIGDLKHLFITHPHGDHVGGLMEILRFCNPNIYVHHQAIPYVRLGESSLTQALRYYKRDHLLKAVSGGETIQIETGRILEIIHTPGHTRGDICILDRKSSSLFSGDLVVTGDEENAYLSKPDPIIGDISQVIDSLARLLPYSFSHLFPGHGCPSLNNAGEHVKNTLFHFIKQEEKQEDMVWIRTGAALTDAGRPEEALPLYDHVLQISPKHPQACVCKGMALLELSRFEEALELFNAALDLIPDLEMALIGKGYTLIGLGKKDQAMAIPVFKEKAYLGGT